MAGRILVLGDDSRSCLTVVRSLGRQGLEVWLGTEEPDSIVPRSRYVRRSFLWPSTQYRVEDWCAELRSLLERETVDLVIPCADNSLVPIVERRASFEPLARFAIPDDVGFACSYSKSRTLELAEELDIPIPPTFRIERPEQMAELRSDERFRLPLVVKPVSSKIWKERRRFDLRVRTVRDWPALERAVSELLAVAPVLVQSWIPGIGAGQEFLASEGRIIDAFQHERVHEPLAGGGSSYRKSVPLDERVLECSRRLLSRLRWTGVAMVEYRQNPSGGGFVLMEINGRFWGSLPLAVAAGVDFPYRLYQLMTAPPPPPRPAYRIGLHARNLAKDLRWFRERLRGSSEEASSLASLVGELATGARNLLAGRERVDTITLDDPIPGLWELWSGLVSPARKLVGRAKNRLERSLLAYLASRQAWRRFQRRRLRRLIAANPRLLFICRGNICRSPFAQAYADSRLRSLGRESIQTSSAGSYPVENRQSPAEALVASREFGVALDAHRSRVLGPSLVKWAGAILCMDERDRRELRAFPEARGKVFYLGMFDSKVRPVVIADPWGRPAEDYRGCYREIAASVDGLADVLKD